MKVNKNPRIEIQGVDDWYYEKKVKILSLL